LFHHTADTPGPPLNLMVKEASKDSAIAAVNAMGVGEPAQTADLVEIIEREEIPDLELDVELRRTLTVIAKAGDNIKVEVPVTGRPKPTVSWQKDNQALKLTQRTMVENTSTSSILTMNECLRSDSGVYSVTGKNIVGSVTENIIVKVHDVPGPPKGPIKLDKIWTKPEYDGGFKITGYIVEKRDLPAGRWIRANFTNIIETTFTVSGLTKDESYEFRVFARNSAGALSNPSEQSDPITCKDDIIEPRIMVDAKFKDVLLVRAGESFKLDADVAGQPLPSMVWTKDGKDVILQDVTKTSVTLSWEKPEHDGGSRVVAYVVEIQPKGSDKWSQSVIVKVPE
uniref:Titin n=1 Tax=Astyanax mexicanus TaxID=7994 RepID=A0A3B1JH55_ASTMX